MSTPATAADYIEDAAVERVVGAASTDAATPGAPEPVRADALQKPATQSNGEDSEENNR